MLYRKMLAPLLSSVESTPAVGQAQGVAQRRRRPGAVGAVDELPIANTPEKFAVETAVSSLVGAPSVSASCVVSVTEASPVASR